MASLTIASAAAVVLQLFGGARPWQARVGRLTSGGGLPEGLAPVSSKRMISGRARAHF
jgi:hypothetical protein